MSNFISQTGLAEKEYRLPETVHRMIGLLQEQYLIRKATVTDSGNVTELSRWKNPLEICLYDIFKFRDYTDLLRDFLSETELAKADRIKRPGMYHHYILRKGITRLFLADHLNIPPSALQFTYNPYGKPHLCQHPPEYFFNISHSEEYLLIGIRKNQGIGVDIEKIDPGLDYHTLLPSVLSEEEYTQFIQLDRDRQLQSFYKIWVQKEAISKALGVGLSIGFNTITVNLDPSRPDVKYDFYHPETQKTLEMTVSSAPDYYQAVALLNN